MIREGIYLQVRNASSGITGSYRNAWQPEEKDHGEEVIPGPSQISDEPDFLWRKQKMRKLASIQRIWKIEPIDGADRIELAHVLGWQCVVNKDQYHPMDLAVYFEIDSFLPIRPEFEFLRASGYKNSTLLGEGFLLRTQKFRGEISQGLALPLDAVLSAEQQNALRTADDTIPCGTDVTELLGVRKWEIPERATGSGTIIGEAAGQIPITDETRIQSEPALLEEFAGVPFYITTKLDGTSCSIAMGADRVMRVFGHNYEFADDGKSPFFEYVKKRGLADKLKLLLLNLIF